MGKIALTGANGFLGFHTRAAMLEYQLSAAAISVGKDFNVESAVDSMSRAKRLVHIAGVNRGNDHEIEEGNSVFATQIADALRRAAEPPPVVVFANSIHASNDSPYGRGKRKASEILAQAATDIGAEFVDIDFPNLFGEYGRPLYNSVTATFCHMLANETEPVVDQNRELTLLHAQDAADLLLGAISPEHLSVRCTNESVEGLLSRLSSMRDQYRAGEIPDVAATFDRDLFNTFRSYTFPVQTPIGLTRHADERGSFFEIVRSHGGPGQSSFSTTEPGITRGDHFHRRKIERFTVLSGQATISLRKLFTNEVFRFSVTGERPVAIDMPTMYSHKITNVGDDKLFTSFWSNEIFDPLAPDTIPETV